MNNTEVLVLNGSPGSGKSTLANALAEQLRQMDTPHAIIDVDELARIYPEHGRSVQWKNLATVWPNYAALSLKVILPVCIDTAEDLQALRDATPCEKFTICELTANETVLKERVTSREPNEYWQTKLRNLVDTYAGREQKFGDFQIKTDSGSIEETTQEILHRLNWKK